MSKPLRLRRSCLPLWLEFPAALVAKLLYRVRVKGLENLPQEGGVLLLSNHISYVDAVILQLASPRPIRFAGYASFAHAHWLFLWLYRITGTIAISSAKSIESSKELLQALKAGELVCLFPEGGVSRTGQLLGLRPGFEALAKKARVPVLPVFHDGLWGSVFSFAGNKYLWKSPRLMPTQVFVVFGRLMSCENADVAGVRKALLDLGAEAFDERPVLKRNLAREAVRALAKHPWKIHIVDRTAERKEVRAATLLGAVGALASHLKKTVPDKRVGVVLPPGAGVTMANLAIACAGKIPVNLNFTAGRAAIEASLRIGEVRTILTADAIKTKFPQFPWTDDSRDLREVMAAAGGKRKIVPWMLAAWLLPNQWFPALLGIPKTGDRAEATLLFTSGSAGEPKGVALTHRNLLANCAQISSTSVLPETGIILACLPIFHSFGSIVGIWYPILRGCKVVSVPSPLDTRKIVDSIKEEKATLLVGAPTFMRPFLKKAEAKELKTLQLVVSGAEKMPLDLYEAFLNEFHIEIMQGYGLTEASPVTNVNQPDPPRAIASSEPQIGKRLGSVGRLLPGITARIVDADTQKDLPLTSQGILLIKGPNIFAGYLKDAEKTAQAIEDGWFNTGDLARFDEQGFLYIEGRLSRFSKIGGEMVPHGTIEQAILDALSLEPAEAPYLAVVGVPDASKGEQIVLVTTLEVAQDKLREKLMAKGLPALWIPKVIHRVESIPLLGSGKLDLKGCKALAMQAAMSEAAVNALKTE